MELNPKTPLAEPSLAVLEIQIRMAQLDKVDEIVRAVNSMREVVGLSQ